MSRSLSTPGAALPIVNSAGRAVNAVLPVVDAAGEGTWSAFARDTRVDTGRLLRRWSRDPAILIQALVFPAFLLIVFDIVLGKTVSLFGAQDSVYGQVPMVALVGAIFGSLTTGVMLTNERKDGLLARFWVVPMHRAAPLAARLLAEAIRTALGTVILVAIGVALGFRFDQGVLAAIALITVPVVLVIGYATMVVALAVRTGGERVVEIVSGVALLMLFFNSGIVPVDQYPGWLQPVVQAQPMSPAIEAMRGLSAGGPVLWPYLQTIAWTVGLVAVFGTVAVRGYRKASVS